MMKRYILLVVYALAIVATAYGQVNIKGSVLDSLGNGIAKVSVMEAGYARAVTTDSEGRFEIQTLQDKGSLLFKHVGYENVIRNFDNGTNSIKVFLIPVISQIEEVTISTGYQSLPKERATGSFEFMDRKMLDTRTGSNVLELLEGLTPGLQFDNRKGSPTLNIRGLSSLNDVMTKPLIVLDNFPYQGDIEHINPNDIESVTLLKDAAAASIWGARAGNGVIVITTKRRKGQDRVAIEYS